MFSLQATKFANQFNDDGIIQSIQ